MIFCDRNLDKSALALLCGPAWAQASPDQPGFQYSNYTILLVLPQPNSIGLMVGIDKQKQIVFVPIPEITKAVNE